MPRSWAPRSRRDARRALLDEPVEDVRESRRPTRTGARRRRTSSGCPPLRGTRRAGRTRAPRAARSSTDRRGWGRDRRRARGAAARPRRTTTGPTTRTRSKLVGARPTNVSSYRSQSRCRSSQASVSAPLRSLSDQLVAITRTFLPRDRRRARRWVERSPGRRRSRRPSARGARARARGASRGCTATGGWSRRQAPRSVAAIERSVPSSKPR